VNPELLGTATLRERDSTEQVRLPLTDIPDVLYKLCSASPLCWADLVAAHGSGTSSTVKEGSAGMLSYLAEQGVAAKLNAAVNELAKAKPADAMAFLVDYLQKHK